LEPHLLGAAPGWRRKVTEQNEMLQKMLELDQQLSHVWMVRTFLKHSDEAAEDEELAEVHRELYDFMLALGPSIDSGDYENYLKLANKKFSKLRSALKLFAEIQPEISGHMNFKMALKSLTLAVERIAKILGREVE
jgi:cob(I)alamin adenosyltransferase